MIINSHKEPDGGIMVHLTPRCDDSPATVGHQLSVIARMAVKALRVELGVKENHDEQMEAIVLEEFTKGMTEFQEGEEMTSETLSKDVEPEENPAGMVESILRQLKPCEAALTIFYGTIPLVAMALRRSHPGLDYVVSLKLAGDYMLVYMKEMK